LTLRKKIELDTNPKDSNSAPQRWPEKRIPTGKLSDAGPELADATDDGFLIPAKIPWLSRGGFWDTFPVKKPNLKPFPCFAGNYHAVLSSPKWVSRENKPKNERR
jgi:hypothetical protein